MADGRLQGEHGHLRVHEVGRRGPPRGVPVESGERVDRRVVAEAEREMIVGHMPGVGAHRDVHDEVAGDETRSDAHVVIPPPPTTVVASAVAS